MRPDITIGELAGRAQSAIQTIRFYERAGLLAPPERSTGNYRLYGERQVERLVFIRHCRSLDLSLDEIRALLALRDAPEKSCSEVNAMLDQHIVEVRRRIADLRRLQEQLRTLRARCRSGRAVKHCRILVELSRRATTTVPQRRVERANRTPERPRRAIRPPAAE